MDAPSQVPAASLCQCQFCSFGGGVWGKGGGVPGSPLGAQVPLGPPIFDPPQKVTFLHPHFWHDQKSILGWKKNLIHPKTKNIFIQNGISILFFLKKSRGRWLENEIDLHFGGGHIVKTSQMKKI